MTSPRDDLLADIQRWKDAAQNLAAQLGRSGAKFDEGIEWLNRGASLREAIHELGASKALRKMEAALDEFRTCRYIVRKSLTNAAIAEGMSIDELIAAFSVPDEIVERFAQEDQGRGAR
jgi:hypothetical protein